MEKVQFIIGRSGSGKTTYCYEAIKAALKEEGHEPLLLLVPEQFNLQTQQELSEKLYPGLLRAEVISFNTLARHIFGETGKVEEVVIEDLERMIILKKIIEAHKKEIIFYKKNLNNTGFLESVNQLITIFEQSGVDEKVLEEMLGQEEDNSLFESKLADLKKIYGYFKEYLSGHFMTIEKSMDYVAKKIPQSKKLEEAHLWIDGFYGFTFTQLQILRQLIKKVKTVTLTLPMDRAYTKTAFVRQSHPFYESIEMLQKLMKVCDEEKISYKVQYLTRAVSEKAETAPEIDYLEKEYLKPYQRPFKEKGEKISLRSYSCKKEEVEEAAKEMIALTREENYRYHDMAVIVGDLPAYQTIVESIFKEYEIPYFLDVKRNIHTNSLVACIEGVLEVMTSNYSYKSMMNYLKTYMLPISKEAIDALENYVLAHGIKGKKKWEAVWQYEPERADDELSINLTREAILKPIEAFSLRIKEAKKQNQLTVEYMTKALYAYLEDIGAYEKIEEIIAKNRQTGNRLLELENTQIWGKVIEVFERLVDILKEEPIDLMTYRRILETSFSYLKMGIIPPAQDQVLVGSLDRTRLPRLKAVFMLGVNEGVIPKVEDSTPIFSDMDKLILTKLCENDKGARGRLGELIVQKPLYGGQFEIYTALTRANSRLFVSAPMADENGKPLRPSIVYYRLKKMFGETPKKEEGFLKEICRPLPAFGYVGEQLREYIEGRNQTEDWKDLVSWYAENPEWKEKLDHLVDYLFYSNQQHYLKPETTKLLYGDTLYTSISRLENFRNCACCYFMRYGIKAEERRIFKWDSAQIGTLFHSALEQYPKELELIGKNWTTADEQEMGQAVKKATLYAVNDLKRSDKETGKFKYTLSKVEKLTKRAVRALTAHLKAGSFVPEGYEISFGEGKGFPPIKIELEEGKALLITGQIDRVDVYYQDEQSQYVKILDYKSGNKNFSLLEVYYGLQLQLLLYLDAYLKINTHYQPGGVFYFHINNPYVSYKVGMEEEEIESAGLKQFKLSGLVLENEAVIEALDKNRTGSTIPVSINKDGSIKKGSSVANMEQFEALENHIIAIVRDLGQQILEGKVSAKPYKLGDKNPCGYCLYHTICQFDEEQRDNCYERLDKLKNDEIWQAIEKEKGGEGHGMD